jgi:hypothetical protein
MFGSAAAVAALETTFPKALLCDKFATHSE